MKNHLSPSLMIRIGLVVFFLTHFLQFPLTARQSGPKTVFWEISGNGLTAPSYLYGTIHILPKKEFVMHKLVEEKLKDCQQLVMEMELDIPLKQKLELAKLLMLPDKQTLREYMDEEEYLKLRTYVLDSLEIKQLRFNIYEKMKPFAFYSALIPEIIGEKTASYELHFNKVAQKKKIPVVGLESFEYQLGIFDSIPIEKQIEMFFDFSEDPRQVMKEMLDMYNCHDIYRMAEDFTKDDKYRHFEKELITDRNHNWVGQLSGLMAGKTSFIAIGAGHLAGEHGLIKLLSEAGYILTPLMLVKCD